jgi:hypothetical protein
MPPLARAWAGQLPKAAGKIMDENALNSIPEVMDAAERPITSLDSLVFQA